MGAMTQSRRIRRAAFQALFQLDAAPEITDDELLASLAEVELSEGERRRTLALARGAFERREEADRLMTELAPAWPAHRQPAVDRALLRLAWFEMASGRTPPKVAISEAVGLAKSFGGEKSPSFVNGLLGEAMHRLGAPASYPGAPAAPGIERDTPAAPPLPAAAEGAAPPEPIPEARAESEPADTPDPAHRRPRHANHDDINREL
jgi:N utilization substance protein B